MNILEAMRDPKLFGAWFKSKKSWDPWFAAKAASHGLAMTKTQAALYRRCTGRTIAPGTPAREVWFIIGRRGGKSLMAGLEAVWRGAFHDYGQYLAPGEVATVAVIAADRRQCRTTMRYINGFFDAVPMLQRMVVNRTRESIELNNRVTIEVHTANFRSVRGYTLAAVIADEVAFWRSEDSANPDVEILNGLRPGLSTIPGALLLCISSPYARSGALWEAYRKHYAQDGDPVLVWQAPTLAMNPNVDASVIAEAYEQDEAVAAAEYGAEFRRDIESFVAREAVDAVVIPDRRELAPVEKTHYLAFVDPSGGSQDSMTLAIAHFQDGIAVLDAIRERRPPFSPEAVVQEFAEVLCSYHVGTVVGDRYAGEWPRERFREHGIEYRTSDAAKSDLYRDLLPLLNSAKVELLDHPKLIAQVCQLERRTSRTGKDSIDHAPGAHDDVANAVAGALVIAAKSARQHAVIAAPVSVTSPSRWGRPPARWAS